tara:strand:- start:537 stop:1046 length:510 start_codon:yes stop_codon:yes gene_type:complete
MLLKNIDLKKTKTINGLEILDLTEPTLIPDFRSINFIIKNFVLVTDELEMRPDLIAKLALGSEDKIDVLLKCNQISNPFSIKSGDILVIPQLESFEKFYKTPKVDEKTIKDTKSLFIDPKKASKKDKNRVDRLSNIAKTKKNGSKEITTPNKLKSGDTNITKNKGSIKF